jgi:glutamate dehydrogenase
MASLLHSVRPRLSRSPVFRTDFLDHSYVKDIQQKICENAAAEYSWFVTMRHGMKSKLTCSITKEYHRNKSSKPRTIISDELSSTLNQLQHDLEVSDLYENMSSRKNVLSRAFPRTLIDKVGLDVLMQRLPEQVSILCKITEL